MKEFKSISHRAVFGSKIRYSTVEQEKVDILL